jgi:addiction module HigA family antidote
MAEYVAKRDRNRCPTHPGELLREDVIPATGKTRSEIAALLGISRQHLYDILNERKPVSPTVAVRLGKLFGDGAGVWARMQSAYDTWNAERELSDEIKRIPTIKTKMALKDGAAHTRDKRVPGLKRVAGRRHSESHGFARSR